MRQPSTTKAEHWPPNYTEAFGWKQQQVVKLKGNPALIAGALEFYRTRPVEFINHWCTTYDPRNASGDVPSKMPFILFERQAECITFLQQLVASEENGLIEKARDVGLTWLCCAYSVWLWRFYPGAAVGWGSRKEQLVDRIGDADSIFEKMRIIIRGLPRFFWPKGFNPDDHMTYMRLLNPENGASITGEAGDNIGRGGRKLAYFKDEAQPLTARVLTPTGWSTMADMVPGAEVVGPDGCARRVTQVKDCGVHDVYRLTFSDGTSTECSPNHLWTVDRVWGKRGRVTLRTHEIATSLAYVSPGGQTQYKYRVPVTAPVQFDAADPLPLDPYVVGALLGDGSVKYVPTSSPAITTKDPEIIAEFRRLLPEYILLTFCPPMAYSLVDALGRRGKKVKSRARQMVVASGIAGFGSATKHIPKAYLLAPVQDRISLLQGLMDTDGSGSGGVASYHTCSPQLSADVAFLVQSLGGTVTHNVKPDARGYLDMHVLHLALPDTITPFRLDRKNKALRVRKHPTMRTIVGAELIDRRPVRCISIDAEDGLYLTDHCIVTHNSAHYDRPEKIEAALADNTRVQVDISSVNGLGNVFHRRREAGVEWTGEIAKGKTNVFIMGWRDHPAKTQEWYDARRAKAEADGLLHVFAQEVDRNYSASVEGLIIPADWVRAAIDAHKHLGFTDDGGWIGALDVADGGGDRNALAMRKGVILKSVEEWGERDTGATARRAVSSCGTVGIIDLQYDSIGVGAGIKAETNRLADENVLPVGVSLVPWNAGAAALWPDDPIEPTTPGQPMAPLNKDFYGNLKAQGWWRLRRRFERTWRARHEPGFTWKPEDLISLPSDLPLLRQVEKELSQPTSRKDGRMRLIVDKTPEGTRSPNLADAIMMAFWPIERKRSVMDLL